MSLTIVSNAVEEPLVWEMRNLKGCVLLLLGPRVLVSELAE